jgi:hypothetical protein
MTITFRGAPGAAGSVNAASGLSLDLVSPPSAIAGKSQIFADAAGVPKYVQPSELGGAVMPLGGAGGLDQEAVDDRVAALLQAGANITLNYNDPGNALAIAAAGGGGGGSVDPLTWLEEYWTFAETAGNYIGAIASSPLTRFGTVTFGVGISGSAVAMTGTAARGGPCLQSPDSAFFSAGVDIPIFICATFLATSTTGTQTVASKATADVTSQPLEWWINFGSTSIAFYCYDGTVLLNNTLTVTIAANTWYTVCAWIDPVRRRTGLQFNGGQVRFVPMLSTWSVRDTSAPFVVGAMGSDTALGRSNGIIGRIDFLGFAKKVPTASELVAINSALLGMVPVAPRVPDSALSGFFQNFWTMEEWTGNRVDKIGAIALTPAGTIGGAATTRAVGMDDTWGALVRGNGSATGDQYRLGVASSVFDVTGSFCVMASFKLNAAVTGNHTIVSRYDPTDNTKRDFWLYYDAADILAIFYDSANGFEETANLGIVPVVGVWYVVIAWYDATAKTVNVEINGALDSVATAATFQMRVNPNGYFSVGTAAPLSAGASHVFGCDAVIDCVGFAKSVPTTAQRTAIFRGGRGPLV